MKTSIAVLAISLIASVSFAHGLGLSSSNTVIADTTPTPCKALAEISFSAPVERSGCCSWHGGVCGCENGRAVCCDGTYSPSCGCLKNDNVN